MTLIFSSAVPNLCEHKLQDIMGGRHKKTSNRNRKKKRKRKEIGQSEECSEEKLQKTDSNATVGMTVDDIAMELNEIAMGMPAQVEGGVLRKSTHLREINISCV